MPNDLRRFLAALQSQPGDLVEIDRVVRPDAFEVTALLKQLDERRRYPAVLFRHPTDQYGQPSPFAILSNVYATRARCGLMLGVAPATPYREVSLAYQRASHQRLNPVTVPAADAPVHETVWQGADADVGRLPIVRHWAMDFGPVLTMPHVMRSREGWYDLSFAKTFYKWDPRQMVVSIHTRDLSRILKEYEDRDEPAPIVNVLGHHPALGLGVMARTPSGADDYEHLGPFLGEPLRLTPSVTWGDRFLVPADAEIVIEGEIPPGQRDVCDPFGEVAGLYQAQCLRPLFDVKAITFRHGAIMQDIFSGCRDGYLGFHAIPREAALEDALRPQFPNLAAIHVPTSGSGMRAAYIAVRDAQPGQVDAIARAVFATMTFGMQLVIVVDAEIDVFDEDQVLWAVHTYTDPARGIRPFAGEARQHLSFVPRSGFGTTNWGTHKLVIDATRPRDFPFGARLTLPDEAMARVRLDDYLPSAAPAEVG
ncbi:MAG TPA: UbiD family decarboxylase [Chloroflexota bacterium]|nr:UbiD family decarboxylase [Chloroflexota bacterium]